MAGSSEGRTCWGHPSPSSGLVKANFFVYYDFYNLLNNEPYFTYPEELIMKIQPTFDEVNEIAATGRYNVLPVSLEILSDFITPIETMKILKNVSTHCYMLESAQANETWRRYTFLGFDPKMEITCVDGEMKLGNLKVKTNCS